MTNQEFEAKSVELVQGMINTMAAKEYAKLALSLPPKASWASYIDAEETVGNGCLGFGKWVTEQLALWEEDYDKKFVIDPFCAPCLDKLRFRKDRSAFTVYRPASFGEELDFWFEIELEEKDGQITGFFDVNI